MSMDFKNVAGVIGINSTWFRNNGKRTDNANNLPAGISSAYLGSGASSLNYPYDYSIVLTFIANDALKVQFAVNSSTSSPHLSYRLYWDGWSSWKQIS